MMKRSIVASAVATMMTVAGAGMAHATVFSGTLLVQSNGSGAPAIDPSLTIADNTPFGFAATMQIGQSVTYTETFTVNGQCASPTCYGYPNMDWLNTTFDWADPVVSVTPNYVGTTPFPSTTANFTGFLQQTIYANFATGAEVGWETNAMFASALFAFANGSIVEVDMINTDQNTDPTHAAITFTLRDIQDVPEPVTLSVLGTGLLGLAVVRRRVLLPHRGPKSITICG